MLIPAAGTVGMFPLSFIAHPLPLSDACAGGRPVARTTETLCMQPGRPYGRGRGTAIPRFRSLCCFTRMESSDRTTPMGQVTQERLGPNVTGRRAATVLAHPLRVRVLEILNQRDMSPIEFCREGFAPENMDVSHVAYHFRELAEYGCLRVIEENKRRGSIEHVYRGLGRAYFSDLQWNELDETERARISKTMVQGLLARVEGALMGDIFDSRTDRHLTWIAMKPRRAGVERNVDRARRRLRRNRTDPRRRRTAPGVATARRASPRPARCSASPRRSIPTLPPPPSD